MSNKRRLVRKYEPGDNPGFLGEGHVARALIQGDFRDTDPFILLMDDMLDKKTNEPVGGPHPHAGFETVTLMLEGELGDEVHKMKAGDLQMMTAGGGIIHTETIDKKARMRLLQLWLNLPKKDRWITPRVQDIPMEHVPKISSEGVELKLYSGSLAGISSPLKNHVPVIIADIRMEPGTSYTLHLPASYATFLYTLDGKLQIGEEKKPLDQNQVGWLDRSAIEGDSELNIIAGKSGARFVLYSGQPQGDNIVSHGPFIADTQEEISGLYRSFRAGKMKHISTVSESQKFKW
ncbi:MAG TPA: pirin-like C-terminal cupin domain-containing protein [Puia sp.]|nr:pirin-like C-terminal cupin domain-containing protein [Puia sp.]